jgi:bacteriocin biosynthesis cyclodehydratase domain-containing protein
MSETGQARLRLCVPCTVIADGEAVHIIGGEDFRFTIRAGQNAQALANLLRECDGRSRVTDLLAVVPSESHASVLQIVERLVGERVLVAGSVELAPFGEAYHAVVEGDGALALRLRKSLPSAQQAEAQTLRILCQQTLDYHAAYSFNQHCLCEEDGAWLWVSTGAAERGYVSPVFLRHAGPCLACLLRHFQRLSPVPQLYEALLRHGEARGPFASAETPEVALAVLEQLVHWKLHELRRAPPSSAVFRLHVLELDTMEVSMHRVFADPTCPECADARVV